MPVTVNLGRRRNSPNGVICEAHVTHSGWGNPQHIVVFHIHLVGFRSWAAGAEGGVCIVGTGTAGALRRGVRARAALIATGGGGAGMLQGRVKGGAPATDRWVGALQGMMAKLLAVGALGVLVEAKVSLQLECGGEGRQVRCGGKVLFLGAGDGDNDSGHAFIGTAVVRCEPSGSLRESEARVEGGDLPGDSV